MAIKESALSLITSIAQGDWIRAVTSAGASRRITVANLAKAIVESYTGSSLAGSNQSVKAALDALNSKQPTMIGGSQVTITDTTNGFIDTGIDSTTHVILAAYTLLNANNVCFISNLNGGNYRVQIMNATDQAIAKSGTYRIYYWVIPR